jgi:hypothetical protein
MAAAHASIEELHTARPAALIAYAESRAAARDWPGAATAYGEAIDRLTAAEPADLARRALRGLAAALRATGDYDGLGRALDRIGERVAALARPELEAYYLLEVAGLELARGCDERSLHAVRRAVSIARALGTPLLRARTYAQLGHVLSRFGRHTSPATSARPTARCRSSASRRARAATSSRRDASSRRPSRRAAARATKRASSPAS